MTHNNHSSALMDKAVVLRMCNTVEKNIYAERQKMATDTRQQLMEDHNNKWLVRKGWKKAITLEQVNMSFEMSFISLMYGKALWHIQDLRDLCELDELVSTINVSSYDASILAEWGKE
jgi:hypothetical protein